VILLFGGFQRTSVKKEIRQNLLFLLVLEYENSEIKIGIILNNNTLKHISIMIPSNTLFPIKYIQINNFYQPRLFPRF
jgi:hypothetical protein